MDHLRAEELVDLAEGTRAESSALHLGDCEICRRQVRDLRAMMSSVSDVEVPEPSPIFWDHFSARVREAIAAETPRPWWPRLWTWPRLIVPAAAGVAVVAALILAPRWTAPPRTAAQFVANVDTFEALDDPSLDLVVDLTPDLNWETAGEAGLTAHGSAEHAVTHLTDGELRELGRLLKEEMARASN